MSFDSRFLDMREAGAYIGRSYRWMQRHYVGLIKTGVQTYRVPKDAAKGRLVFAKESLDRYIESCRIESNFEGFNGGSK